ncbi:MAG TPA: protein kinase [Kofleriaceae bacterium]|jgi:serine/threonine-protein kinase|nr:protein kinase [Kofleriaceae bacterium]
MAGEVFGSYRVVDEIGRGGMGAVYLAEHALLGRQAAIKVLLREMSHRPDLVTRFFNEARAATAVKHPGIVEIYDFGYAADGSAYIVMEFLQGESLASRLRRTGPFLESRAAALCRQVAGGLGAAHAKGIVHRDLKPDNIFVVPDADIAEGERPKILDFGIAKLASEQSAGQSMTRTGMVMGTPAYMAPEQCKGAGQVDARSDLYALGCILYEMVSGRPPFVAEGAGEVMALHIFSAPPPPRAFAPVSAALEQVILRALAKDPDHRFRSAEEMAAALQAVQPSGAFPRAGATDATRAMLPYGAGVHPPPMPSAPQLTPPALFAPVPVMGPPPTAQTTMSAAAGVWTTGPHPRKRRWLAPVSMAALMGVGGLVFVEVRGGGQPPPVEASSPTERTPAAEPRPDGSTNPKPVAPADPKPVAPADPKPVAPAGSASEPSIATSEVTRPPTAAAKIKLAITSNPAGAEVYRMPQGVRIGFTPLDYSTEAMAGEVVFSLKKPGFRDETVSLPADRDGDKAVALVRKAGAPRPHAATPGAASPGGDDFFTRTPASSRDSIDPFAKPKK